MAVRKAKADCNWYDPFAKYSDEVIGDVGGTSVKIPIRKGYSGVKPIARSTIAVKEVIRVDAENYATLNQLREIYANDPLQGEELAVVDAYIKRGYGGIPAKLAIKYRC